MGRQERFLKWLVEEQKTSLADLEKHGLIPMLVMVIGFYEKWRTSTECGRQIEWDSPYFPESSTNKVPTVNGNHPIAEAVSRKLFGIESVPKEAQSRMVRQAIKTAVEVHEALMSNVPKS